MAAPTTVEEYLAALPQAQQQGEVAGRVARSDHRAEAALLLADEAAGRHGVVGQ